MEKPTAVSHFLHFGYGSNMCLGKLHHVAASAVPIGPAWIDGYRLTWDKVSTKDGSGKCDCHYTGKPDDQVWGVLFRIAREDLVELTKSEGGYDEKLLEVMTSTGERKAITYIARAENKNSALIPFHWYKQHALDGALAAGLPDAYITDFIRSVDAVEDRDRDRVSFEEAKRSA